MFNVGLELEIPTPGWGPHPVTGDGGGELSFQNPGGRGIFLKIPRGFGGIFY